jgi:hypothetical protein
MVFSFAQIEGNFQNRKQCGRRFLPESTLLGRIEVSGADARDISI